MVHALLHYRKSMLDGGTNYGSRTWSGGDHWWRRVWSGQTTCGADNLRRDRTPVVTI